MQAFSIFFYHTSYNTLYQSCLTKPVQHNQGILRKGYPFLTHQSYRVSWHPATWCPNFSHVVPPLPAPPTLLPSLLTPHSQLLSPLPRCHGVREEFCRKGTGTRRAAGIAHAFCLHWDEAQTTGQKPIQSADAPPVGINGSQTGHSCEWSTHTTRSIRPCHCFCASKVINSHNASFYLSMNHKPQGPPAALQAPQAWYTPLPIWHYKDHICGKCMAPVSITLQVCSGQCLAVGRVLSSVWEWIFRISPAVVSPLVSFVPSSPRRLWPPGSGGNIPQAVTVWASTVKCTVSVPTPAPSQQDRGAGDEVFGMGPGQHPLIAPSCLILPSPVRELGQRFPRSGRPIQGHPGDDINSKS